MQYLIVLNNSYANKINPGTSIQVRAGANKRIILKRRMKAM